MSESDTKLIFILLVSLVGTLLYLGKSGNLKTSKILDALSLGLFRFLWIDVMLYAGDILLSNTANIIFSNYAMSRVPSNTYVIVSAILYLLLNTFSNNFADKVLLKNTKGGDLFVMEVFVRPFLSTLVYVSVTTVVCFTLWVGYLVWGLAH